jgi:hypothetical protein
MKNGIFTLIFCLLATALSAQQSVDTLISRSKVQKKIFIVRKNDPKESFKAELSQAIESGGGQAVLSRGPNQSFYLIKETAWKRDGLTRVYVQKANFLNP